MMDGSGGGTAGGGACGSTSSNNSGKVTEPAQANGEQKISTQRHFELMSSGLKPTVLHVALVAMII